MPEDVSFLCQKGKAVKNVKESLEGNSHSARGRQYWTILSFLVLRLPERLKPSAVLPNKIVNFVCFTAQSKEEQTKS